MKNIKINNRMTPVFVLKETDSRIVYIPVNHLHRVDYDRLKEIEKAGGNDMLAQMRRTKLSNGINALTAYDKVIQVADKVDDNHVVRLKKPEELDSITTSEPEQKTVKTAPAKSETTTDDKPAPKRRGRKPKSETTESDSE
ncbi:MAG: hypothetical protein CMF22_11165 [Idiomarinaceae bacterium]|nr:hypothetical protein [Idiomarinaceae bacterium]|tara:strand:+ start:150083 stop:150505 length:423 start_codon:yes stop_codon:yes gene_type:complete